MNEMMAPKMNFFHSRATASLIFSFSLRLAEKNSVICLWIFELSNQEMFVILKSLKLKISSRNSRLIQVVLLFGAALFTSIHAIM